MSNLKQFIMQVVFIVISLILFGFIFMYVMKNMFNSFKDSILTKPYPHVYDAPVSVQSKSIYNGSNLNAFTKNLDSLADRLD